MSALDPAWDLKSFIAEAGHVLATQSKEQPPEDDYFV
jgi:hypothetical protein